MAVTVEVSKQVLLLNVVSGVLTRILRVTALVWVYQYLLHRISQDEFAVYAVVTAVMVFAPLVSSLFTSGINRYVVEACARGDEQRVTQIVSSIFPVLVCWGVVFVAAGWLFAWHIDHFLTIAPERLMDARLMMILLVSDFALQTMMTPFAAGFAVRQRYVLLNLIELGVELFRMSLLFTLLFGIGARVIWVVVVSVVANFLSLIARSTISRRLLPALRVKVSLFRWATSRQLFAFGLWTTLIHLAGLIHINADIILLNQLATPFDVAVFKLGSEFYNQITGLVIATLVPMLPVLTSLHAREGLERLGETVLRSARYILWASLLLVLPIVIYSQPLITLYAGVSYLPAAKVASLLLSLFLFMPAGFLLAPLAQAAARLRAFSLANVIIQAAKLLVTVYFVKKLHLGAIGCAVSTVVVVGSAHLVVLGPMTLRMCGVRYRRYAREVLAKGIVPVVAGGATWMLLGVWVAPASWPSLLFCGALGAVVYVVALLACCLNQREKAELFWVRQRATRALEQACGVET